jgi:hypothetical protein
MLGLGLALNFVFAQCSLPTRIMKLRLALMANGTIRVLPTHLQPGIYETAPYSGLVLVPGSCGDERAIIVPSVQDFSMPMVEPDLRFIPRTPAK